MRPASRRELGGSRVADEPPATGELPGLDVGGPVSRLVDATPDRVRRSDGRGDPAADGAAEPGQLPAAGADVFPSGTQGVRCSVELRLLLPCRDLLRRLRVGRAGREPERPCSSRMPETGARPVDRPVGRRSRRSQAGTRPASSRMPSSTRGGRTTPMAEGTEQPSFERLAFPRHAVSEGHEALADARKLTLRGRLRAASRFMSIAIYRLQVVRGASEAPRGHGRRLLVQRFSHGNIRADIRRGDIRSDIRQISLDIRP